MTKAARLAALSLDLVALHMFSLSFRAESVTYLALTLCLLCRLGLSVVIFLGYNLPSSSSKQENKLSESSVSL